MTEFNEQIQTFRDEIDNLESDLASSTTAISGFRSELSRTSNSIREASETSHKFQKSMSRDFKSAFENILFEGQKVSDALKGVANSVLNRSFNSAISPVTDALGTAVAQGVGSLVGGLMPFANGGAFSQGRVRAFANGGVVDGPTHFPMAGGNVGLMGEAGPEAIMPLSRGADGKLGVKAAQGSPNITVNISVSTPDVQGFERSKSQISQGVGRAIAKASKFN